MNWRWRRHGDGHADGTRQRRRSVPPLAIRPRCAGTDPGRPGSGRGCAEGSGLTGISARPGEDPRICHAGWRWQPAQDRPPGGMTLSSDNSRVRPPDQHVRQVSLPLARDAPGWRARQPAAPACQRQAVSRQQDWLPSARPRRSAPTWPRKSAMFQYSVMCTISSSRTSPTPAPTMQKLRPVAGRPGMSPVWTPVITHLAAPQLPRRQGLLRHLHRARRRRRRDRAHPARAARPDHRGRAGPRRAAAAQRQRVPAAAMQRPRGPRPVGQPRLAERRRHRHHRDAAHAVRRADGHDTVPHIDATKVTIWLSIALAAGLAAAGLTLRLGKSRRGRAAACAARAAQQLADAAAYAAQTGHRVTRAQTRHARPARLPRRRRTAPADQGHPARHPPSTRTQPTPGPRCPARGQLGAPWRAHPPGQANPSTADQVWAPAALRTVQPEAYITKPRSAEPIKAIRGRRGG